MNNNTQKKLLFVIDSLECAGAEKSLISLLNLLDYKKYSVDLLLFSHNGILEMYLPKSVNLLPPLKYTDFAKLNLKDSFIFSLKNLDFSMLKSRIKYSLDIRKKEYSNNQIAKIYWENISRHIEINDVEYDVAISYAQSIPTFYVGSKVKANKKITWVNTNIEIEENDIEFHKQFYNTFEKIVVVSDTAKKKFIETFSYYENNVEVIYDINNPKIINELSNEEINFFNEYKGYKILTIGRLTEKKGIDIAIETAKKLMENDLDFKWFVLGKGPLQKKLEKKILQYNLQNYFFLLGIKSNPYPYIKNSDLYVQTSRLEGYGLAIAEARILNIPVVTTNFEGVSNQIKNGENGIIVDINSEAVFNAVMEIKNNEKLQKDLINNLKNEKKGNLEEIHKLYKLIW